MTDLRTAAQAALEAMENNQYAVADQAPHRDVMAYHATIENLRAALAEDALERMSEDERRLGIQMQPVQEPVAWMDIDSDGNRLSVRQWSDGNWDEVPLYIAPPQRKPLTEEEMRECFINTNTCEPLDEGWPGLERFARAIERAHGIGGGA